MYKISATHFEKGMGVVDMALRYENNPPSCC